MDCRLRKGTMQRAAPRVREGGIPNEVSGNVIPRKEKYLDSRIVPKH
jgi:hypothetical protein